MILSASRGHEVAFSRSRCNFFTSFTLSVRVGRWGGGIRLAFDCFIYRLQLVQPSLIIIVPCRRQSLDRACSTILIHHAFYCAQARMEA